MAYSPELYIHELDRKAFEALNMFPQLVKLQQAYIENVDEKAARLEFMSSAVRLSDRQMPEVYALLLPICEKLGIEVPDMFMVQSKDMKDINAFTVGTATPIVCVTSELIKQLPAQMAASIIAHECGHIACKHYLYHSLARSFANGLEASPLYKIPAVRKHLSKALVTALLFWDRCSELSADRAAVLCDGDAGITIDTLIRVHGFDLSVDREEFIRQALDLKALVRSSDANKIMEQMIVQWDSHPMLATRVYECCDWEKSARYMDIINGTACKADEHQTEEAEVIAAQASVSEAPTCGTVKDASPEAVEALNARLRQLNSEIERYTVHEEKIDYAYAVSCGILSGWLDSMYFSDTANFENNLDYSNQLVNSFIHKYADWRGIGKDRLKDAIRELENKFPVAQDNVWSGKKISICTKNHHLADLAHHPTPLGLIASLAVQFLRVGTFVNKKGEWHFIALEADEKDIMSIAVPAVITGVLNWLVYLSENKYEEETGKELPKAIRRLTHIIASTPSIVEIAKCADNWFGHLVSDMGGSKQSAGAGMGIPGVFMSLLYEVAALPAFKDTGLTMVLNDLYQNHGFDLRRELAYAEQLKIQAIPVIFNEIFVRVGCMLLHFGTEVSKHGGLNGVNWSYVIPFENRTVDRMIAVAAMTFNIVDTGDAAVRAAIESGGDWVIFSGSFVARYNYVGAGRACVAVVKEFSNEKKEAQLIHERMLLMEAKAQMMYEQLQEFKARLEEKLTEYLAEDIEAFMSGFDDINAGLETNNSDLVIKGNVIIQRALGRDIQFSTQAEFDELMNSDIPLTL